MAYSVTLPSGQVLIVPDSSVDTIVSDVTGGTATSGIVAIVGESDEGASFSQEIAGGNKLSANSFGPADINKVIAKYGSGRIVDAFKGISAPSASPRVVGGPQRVIVIKTNDSTSASKALVHGTAAAKRGGEMGNQIQLGVTSSTPESAPTTGKFSYITNADASLIKLRVNGGAEQSLNTGVATNPTLIAQGIKNLTNLDAVGGIDRNVLSGLVGQSISTTSPATMTIKVSLSAGQVFSVAPQIGDTLEISASSVISGGTDQNAGFYMVTAVSNTTSDASITALKYSDYAGAPTQPVVVTSISIAATTDIAVYSPMEIKNMSGTNRNVIQSAIVGQSIVTSAVQSLITFSLASGSFSAESKVGDLLRVNSGAYAGAGNANIGWYQVVEASNASGAAYVKASRLSNGSPVSVASAAISNTTEIQVFDPQIAGVGKTLEIYDGTGSLNISGVMKDLGTSNAASFIGQLIVSDAELKKTVTVKRESTSSLESFTVGGDIALKLGYVGTTASVTIGLVGGLLKLTTTVSGGSGANLNLDLSKIATISQLVSKINENVGYSAEAGSNAIAQLNPSILDRMTTSICSPSSKPGRIKKDLYDLTKSNKGLLGSALVTYTASATAGLPEDSILLFLSGGAKGATSGLQFSKAVDALQSVRANFIVPLVSQDAAKDVLEGLTDGSSTYTVDAVNAAVKSHCLTMSTAKVKRHRIGVVSKKGTFAEVKASAQSMSTFRVAHLFQDIKDLSATTGNIEQFQPWMASIKAAGMQAAASYRGIFNKALNISGATQAANDFDDENVTDLEDALSAGLIPLQRQANGSYSFASDQMTYSVDNNVVYNSLQAVYIADLMALSLAESLKNAFVGESVADVTVGAVESFVKAKMSEFLGLKYTVGTSTYPQGWKSIAININGSILSVDVSAIEATTVKFIPISLTLEGVKASSNVQG